MSDGERSEHDSMGEIVVPAGVKWQAQTQRAVGNFPVSGQPVPKPVIVWLAQIKAAAAHVNAELGVGGIDASMADAIAAAAAEVIDGAWFDQFPIDVFQTGSGTSTNMNMNEVLATLAAERLAAAGRRPWRPPQRPRQRLAVEQRRRSVGDQARRRRAADDGPPAGAERARRRAARAVRGRARHREGWSNPPDGRDAGHVRPGAGWVRPHDRARHRTRHGDLRPAPGAAARGHRGGYGYELPGRVRAGRHRASVGRRSVCRSQRPPTTSRRKAPRTSWWR